MKTIGAKNLRLHLDQVLDRVLDGEDIVVHHRFKRPVRLSAVYGPQDDRRPAKLAGLRTFDAAAKKPSPFDKHTSVKELYDESISSRYVRS